MESRSLLGFFTSNLLHFSLIYLSNFQNRDFHLQRQQMGEDGHRIRECAARRQQQAVGRAGSEHTGYYLDQHTRCRAFQGLSEEREGHDGRLL